MAFDPSSFSQMTNILSGFNYPQKRKIVTVNGLKEAQDFKLNYGESILFLDANQDILYVKQCDEIGKVSLNVYQCTEITQNFITPEPSPVSRADLDAFQSNLLEEVKKLIGGQNELNDKTKQ